MMAIVAAFAVTTTLALGMQSAEAMSMPKLQSGQPIDLDRGCPVSVAANASKGRCIQA